MYYFKQLDTLRCIAVMIVILHHLPIIDSGSYISVIFEGVTGVDVFFVLSGFLITHILLRSKESKQPAGQKLRTFYIRRFFRIFPIYYLAITILIILNPMEYRSYCMYDLLYISNIKMGLQGDFSSVTPHFWSLAVEEQFYLFWPFLILFTRKNIIPYLLVLFLLLGLSFKIYYINTVHDFLISRSVGNLVYLSSGGILAYLFYKDNKNIKKLSFITPFLIIIYLIMQFLSYSNLVNFPVLITLFVQYSLCTFLVASFASGIKGVIGRIAESKFLIYLGKISYGLYIYHMLMVIPLAGINKIVMWLDGPNLVENLYLANFIKIILTFIIATISWQLIEKPINKIKDRFSFS
jgi:peptidoglycan/LPS O-acetylase OafA/YrhL